MGSASHSALQGALIGLCCPRGGSGSQIIADGYQKVKGRSPAVGIGRVLADRGKGGHEGVVRGEMTYRVGGPRIAGKQESLAAATAKVLLAPGAAPARLAHPVGSPEGAERRRVAPDVRQGVILHGPELEPWYGLRGVTRQHSAGGRDVEGAAAPATHARLGITRVVIGDDRVDDDAAMVARPQLLHGASRALDLLRRRHQGGAVLQRPAVVLNMRDLDAARPQRQGQLHHVGHALDIGAVHDGVDGEREAEPHHLGGSGSLALISAAITGDLVRGGGRAVLDRDLNVVEPRLIEGGEGLGGEADRGGDQVGIETRRARGGGDLDEVAPGGRLAARQVHLQHTERGCFAKDARPGGEVELVLARIERERIGAIGTAERAAMGQLGQQTQRARERRIGLRLRPRENVHQLCSSDAIYYRSRSFLSARERNSTVTSARMRSRGAAKVAARSSTIAANVASPVQRLRISTAIASALKTRSGASRTHPPCASLCVSRTPRGSFGLASSDMAGGGVSFKARVPVAKFAGVRAILP